LLVGLHTDIVPQLLDAPSQPQTPAFGGEAPTHEPEAPVGQSESARHEMVPAVIPTQIVSLVLLVRVNCRCVEVHVVTGVFPPPLLPHAVSIVDARMAQNTDISILFI
jgi:hypothetical protein